MTRKFFVFTALPILFMSFTSQTPNQENIAKTMISLVRYIEWPSSMKQGNFKVGVYGSFEMYKAFAQEAMGVGLQNRNTDVINLTQPEQINLTPLHIIIVSDEKCTESNLSRILKTIGNKPTLIITNREGATKIGSSINFIVRNNKTFYEINKSNIQKNGILIAKEVEQFAYKEAR